MRDKLNRVNKFLSEQKAQPEREAEIVVSGPDCIKNIFVSEAMKAAKLELVSDELINYLTDSKAIKNLSYKEKQGLLRDVTAIKADSRDFMVRFAELSTKNALVQEVLELAKGPQELVKSENGEVYVSSIDESTRKELSELLRNVINDRIREGA